MADKEEIVSHDDAGNAVLRGIVEATNKGDHTAVANYALAYRYLAGGPQPGSAFVAFK